MQRPLLLWEYAILLEAYARMSRTPPPKQSLAILREDWPDAAKMPQFNSWFTLYFKDSLPAGRLPIAIPIQPATIGTEVFVVLDKCSEEPVLLDYLVPESMPTRQFAGAISQIDRIFGSQLGKPFVDYCFTHVIELSSAIAFAASTSPSPGLFRNIQPEQFRIEGAVMNQYRLPGERMLEGVIPTRSGSSETESAAGRRRRLFLWLDEGGSR